MGAVTHHANQGLVMPIHTSECGGPDLITVATYRCGLSYMISTHQNNHLELSSLNEAYEASSGVPTP